VTFSSSFACGHDAAAAWGHIYQAVEHDNHAAYNTGPILYADILVPLIALGLLVADQRLRGVEARERMTAAPAPGD
jgi:hypothetical protein